MLLVVKDLMSEFSPSHHQRELLDNLVCKRPPTIFDSEDAAYNEMLVVCTTYH